MPLRGFNSALKRIVDVALSAGVVILGALPALAIAAIIRRSSPGPIFYTQERNGFNILYLTEPDPRGSMGLGGKSVGGLGSAGDFLVGLDPMSGKAKWRHEFPGGGGGGLLVTAGDVLFSGDGAGNFATRIFLDQKSHRPLMLVYRGVAPRVTIQTQQGPPPEGGRGRGDMAHDGAAAPAPQIVDITLFLDDYKSIGGVMLPHRMARSIDGKPSEEITLKTIKINPAFKPDTFAAK